MLVLLVRENNKGKEESEGEDDFKMVGNCETENLYHGDWRI